MPVESSETHRDVTSTGCRRGITQEREDRVHDLVWVVEVQRITDRAKDCLVRVLLRNLATNRAGYGAGNREGDQREKKEGLDEDHGENYVCGARTSEVVSTKGEYASDLGGGTMNTRITTRYHSEYVLTKNTRT